MRAPQLAEDAVQVVLLARCRHAAIAAGPVAQYFGLSLQEAELLLEKGRGVIASRVPLQAVQRAMPLLAAIGVRIAVQSHDAPQRVERFDLSLRLLEAGVADDVVTALQRLGVKQTISAADFAGPSGLLLSDLPEGRALVYASAMRKLVGVQATLCARTEALYDLFARAGTGKDLAPLRRHLGILGCGAFGPGSAIGVGLDHHVLTHVLARFPQFGLYAVNQAFQRYDLRLTGLGGLSPHELQDFLFTRGFGPAEVRGALQSNPGLRVETGLSRTAALQFMSDYATIGLSVLAELIVS